MRNFRTLRGFTLTEMAIALTILALLIGFFLWNGKLYPGKHEAIITMEQFNRVQEIIGRPGTPKPQKYMFPFTGLIRCGACGLMVTAEHKINRQGHRYIYYHCSKRNQLIRCQQPSIEAKALEDDFIRFLKQVSISAALKEELTRIVVAEQVAGSQNKMNGLDSYKEELRTLKAQAKTLTDLRVRGIIEDAEFLSRRKDIDLAIAETGQRLENQTKGSDWFEPALVLVSFHNQAISWFRHGTDDVKRSIVNIIGSNPTLTDKKLLIQAKKPFVMGEKQQSFLTRSG